MMINVMVVEDRETPNLDGEMVAETCTEEGDLHLALDFGETC